MENTKRTQETLFDIPIFTWEDWDIVFTDTFQFYNVEFPFDSMKQYNGCDVSKDSNGYLTITKIGEEIENSFYKTEVVWEGFVCEIPEFIEELNKKYRG